MGFDAWADGATLESCLESCRASPKYQKGEWFALEKNGKLVSALIEGVLKDLQEKRNSKIIYPYSDINPEFYERFGFKILPQELQKYKTTICMVRFASAETNFNKLNPPKYF